MTKPNSIIQLTKPDALPLSLENVKLYLKITHKHDDDLLNMLISSVASKCEIYTGLSLISKDFRLEYKNPINQLHIPLRPLQRVESIRFSRKLETEEISPKYYSVSQDSVTIHVFLSGQIYLYCSCGFGDSHDYIPQELKLIMTNHVSDLYETRRYQSNFNMDAYNDFRFFKI